MQDVILWPVWKCLLAQNLRMWLYLAWKFCWYQPGPRDEIILDQDSDKGLYKTQKKRKHRHSAKNGLWKWDRYWMFSANNEKKLLICWFKNSSIRNCKFAVIYVTVPQKWYRCTFVLFRNPQQNRINRICTYIIVHDLWFLTLS